MSGKTSTLHLLCGKIASGKSTLVSRLASAPATVLIAEDSWLSRLYPNEITTLEDYVRYSGRLGDVLGGHVEALLEAGLSVVLDFPANTVSQRQWMRGIFEDAGAAHQLHYLDVSDAVCKARLLQRNEDGAHAFAPSAADFDLFTRHFVPPSPDEDFNLRVYSELECG